MQSLVTHIKKPRTHKLNMPQPTEGGLFIELFVHYPDTPKKQALLDARVAKFHAEYVAQYIHRMQCPAEQKLELLDAIAKTILAHGEKEP